MNSIALQFEGINIIKAGLVAASLVLVLGIAIDYVSVAMAQSSSIELVTGSISGGGGEMSGGSVLLESSIGQSEPVGSSSSANFSLESGFIPVIAQQGSVIETNGVAIPSMTLWGYLIAGAIFVVLMIVRLRRAVVSQGWSYASQTLSKTPR